MGQSLKLFFIDTDDGLIAHQDGEGLLLRNADAARALALRALVEMAADQGAIHDDRLFSVTVRNAALYTLYRASLTLHGEWLLHE